MMTNLPRSRQRGHGGAATARVNAQANAQENLTRAFLTFTQAAGSLERSYTQLQTEVARLHQELQRTNSELERSLEENERMRGYLSRVLESLPCGVVVMSDDGGTQVINTEARKLLKVPGEWKPGEGSPLPASLQRLIAEAPKNAFFSEQEWATSENGANRHIGILRSNIERDVRRSERHDLDRAGHYRTEAAGGRAGSRAKVARAAGDCDDPGA